MQRLQSEVQATLVGRPVMLEAQSYRNALQSLRVVSPEMLFELATLPGLHRTIGNVSVVRVMGSLFRSMFFSDYDDIRQSFDQALADPSTDAVLLEVDSPGGGVTGVFDLAEHIYQARGGKPIWAIAADQMTSSAYLLGSAADRAIGTPTSVIGSIGVIATHIDETGLNDRVGLVFSEIVAGAKKSELSSNHPLGDDGRATLQGIVDQAYDQFVGAVSRYRGLAESAVRAQEAGTFTASVAMGHGLIDEVLGFDDLIEKVQSAAPKTAASQELDQRLALLNECVAAKQAGRGTIYLVQAEELAAKVGHAATIKLIRDYGEGAFFQVMSTQYWEAQ